MRRNLSSREIISGFLLNCVRQMFVSCTESNLLVRMYDFRKCTASPPEVDFKSSRSPAKSESWNSHNLHCCAVFPTRQYSLNSHRVVYVRNQASQAFVKCSGPFSDYSCRVCLQDHRTYLGLPMRAKYRNFRTIWVQMFDGRQGMELSTLYSCWDLLSISQLAISRSTHFFAWPLHIKGPCRDHGWVKSSWTR